MTDNIDLLPPEEKDEHDKAHYHSHEHHHHRLGTIITIRSHSGLSGDMLLTGFALLNMAQLGLDPLNHSGKDWLNEQIGKILPEPNWAVTLRRHAIHGINGWQTDISLPHSHAHRHLGEILDLIGQMKISAKARSLAAKCFELLAHCEASVHGTDIDKIHFHEVGALDSILDICCVCEFYSLLNPDLLLCSPLPVCDGAVACAHGVLPAPAPATLQLLKNIPVRPFAGDLNAGELVTPTAIALLHILEPCFGSWPEFTVCDTALVYGQKEFTNAPNGCIFALGHGCQPV